MRLITNECQEGEKLPNRMKGCIEKAAVNEDVLIASAFFSNSRLIEKIVENGCTVKAVVRLNVGTEPSALRKALGLKGQVQFRYFTSTHFHPKMYIIGDKKAYIGSANMTDPGMLLNNEVCMELDSEDFDFDELKDVFQGYWDQAEVLDLNAVSAFEATLKERNHEAALAGSNVTAAIEKALGSHEYVNYTDCNSKGGRKESMFASEFKRDYQKFLLSFAELKEAYSETGMRMFPDIPLRIEIDRFLWWIREYKAKGESWDIPSEKPKAERDAGIHPLVSEFVASDIKYLKERAVSDFTIVHESFSSQEKIDALDADALFETLLHVHSFKDQLRFRPGGIPGLRERFDSNDIGNVKRTIKYLLFGPKQYQGRIANCVFGKENKLIGFGSAVITELYGLVNNDEIPVRNGRTQKSLKWLGYGKC